MTTHCAEHSWPWGVPCDHSSSPNHGLHRYWGATEKKTHLGFQATSTIESDGLRSGRNRRMATIRDRLGDRTATQRLGSIKYFLMRANLRPVCWLWLNRSSTASQRAAAAARVPIELTYNPVLREPSRNELGTCSESGRRGVRCGLLTNRPELK